MELNKDSALRAKELAEKMLLQKDFGVARMLAMKALELYPKLDGLPLFLATIEVYISSENRINGEVDWYRILGVQSSADEETIRRSYRKLALTLHPDKNRSVGADGAFHLITQAWSLLSDKAKRIAYDQKCSLREICHGNPGGKRSIPASQNGLHGNSVLNPVLLKPTFWTFCSSCKTKFEYHNVYLNNNLVCTCCHKPFLASETLPPPGRRNVSSTQMKQHNLNSMRTERNYPVSGRTPMSSVNSSVGSAPFSMPNGIFRVPASASGAAETPTPDFFRMSSENLKSRHEDSTPVSREIGHFGKAHAVERTGASSACQSSMPNGIFRVPASASSAAEALGVFRMSSENLKKTHEDSSPVSAHFGKAHAMERTGAGSAFQSSMPNGIFRVPTSASIAERTGAGSGFQSSMPNGIFRVPTSASIAAEHPGVFRMSSESLKRMLEDSAPVSREDAHFGKAPAVERTGAGSAFQSSLFSSNPIMKGDRPRKKRPNDEHKVASDKKDMENKTASQKEGTNLANEFGSGRVNAAGNYKRNGVRDRSQHQIKNILAEMARKEILKKLDEWKAYSASKNLDKSKNTETEIREKRKEREINGVKPGAQVIDSETVDKKCFSADPEPEMPGSLSMNVPDPDFHDFDGDRIENAFGENQVWAAYDNDDGMPRYYCLIHDVISKNPLNMRISWLNAKSNDEFAPIKWVSSGFPKTSGDFRIGKRVSYNTLNSFSHRVKWTKGARGIVHIYPKKGDVWALYRNWSLDWNEFTDDEIIQKYDMVEVLEDYNEEQGVNIAPLIKVAGFKTVFRQNVDPRKVNNISKAEMFRFSHQVPSYLLTGEEGHNAPKGCLELDPAATPMELLQVLAEDLEQEIVMTTEKNVEDELKHGENSMEEDLIKKCQTTKEEGSVEGLGEKKRKPESCQTTKEEVSDERLGEKKKKPEILFVYKRRRLGEKRAVKS